MRHGSGGHVYKPKFKAADGSAREGNWRIRLAWRDATTGQRRTLDELVPCPADKQAASLLDAKQHLKQRIAQATGRMLGSKIKAEDLTYEKMREDLLTYYRGKGCRTLLTDKNGKEYISSLNHLDKFFTRRLVLSINSDALEEFAQSRRAAKASDTSIARSLELLRSMFNRQVKKANLLPTDVPFFQMPAKAKPRTGSLDSKDYPTLLAALAESLRPVLTLGFYTGMRLGEIRRLRWDGVDIDGGMIRLTPEETKNNTARAVPIPTDLLEWLKIARLKSPAAVYVFGGAKPLGTFRKRWMKACDKAEVPGLRFHDLRRGAVTRLSDSGVPVHVAMGITGHKSVEAWKGYMQKQDAALKDAMRTTEQAHANELKREANKPEQKPTANTSIN